MPGVLSAVKPPIVTNTQGLGILARQVLFSVEEASTEAEVNQPVFRPTVIATTVSAALEREAVHDAARSLVRPISRTAVPPSLPCGLSALRAAPLVPTFSAAKTILAGRKCVRMLKDSEELVWLPPLVAALMEGLEQYASESGGNTSPRGVVHIRSDRNKRISRYIYEKTGLLRTAKQVGSRIGRIRPADGEEQLEVTMCPSWTAGQTAQPIQDSASAQPGRYVVHTPSMPGLELATGDRWEPLFSSNLTSRVTTVKDNGPGTVYPQHESNGQEDCPAVTLLSSSPLSLFSRCTVLRGGTMVHSDGDIPLLERDIDNPGSIRYRQYTISALECWNMIAICDAPEQYTVVQEIFPTTGNVRVNLLTIEHRFTRGMETNTLAGESPPISPPQDIILLLEDCSPTTPAAISFNHTIRPGRPPPDGRLCLPIVGVERVPGACGTSPVNVHASQRDPKPRPRDGRSTLSGHLSYTMTYTNDLPPDGRTSPSIGDLLQSMAAHKLYPSDDLVPFAAVDPPVWATAGPSLGHFGPRHDSSTQSPS
ncbi:hypothetical protein C8Q77DRAFT_1121720 [Trametes polyzona]|nr:hypothetical protein C8Q77DRAFT_1121720 [Trametes polyzona]